jgi:hypothetical protein
LHAPSLLGLASGRLSLIVLVRLRG